jgi:hypothetical protein
MEIHEQIIAKRFVLIDDKGEPLAYLTGEEAGFVGVSIAGAGGQAPLVTIGVEPSTGMPSIVVLRRDSQGERRGAVAISVTEDGRAAIRLEDADGAERTITT